MVAYVHSSRSFVQGGTLDAADLAMFRADIVSDMLAANMAFVSTLGALTTDATPAVLAGGRSIVGLASPESGTIGVVRVTGAVVARNISTGECSCWDVAAVLKVLSGVASMVGMPSVTVFSQDAGLSSASLAVSANVGGAVLTATGFAGATIAWSGSLLISTV